MKWVRERDHLIAQTMAFVQSVTGICRTEAFNPDDLKPLARRAEVLLLAV